VEALLQVLRKYELRVNYHIVDVKVGWHPASDRAQQGQSTWPEDTHIFFNFFW
jgi:hypothetical protein